MLNQESVKLNNLLNIEQVADLLGIKKSTVYSYTHYKTIPFVKIGRLVKFEVSKILEWKDKMPSCDGKPLSDCGIRKLRKENQGLNSQQVTTSKPCKPPSDTNIREVLMKGVYKIVNKSGVRYGIDYVDSASGKRVKRIVSLSKEKAEQMYRKIQVEMDEGKWPGTKRKAPLFEDFVDTYLESCKNQDSRTHYVGKLQCLKKDAAKAFNGIRLDQISIAMIERFKNQRASAVSNSTCNRGLSYLRHFFNKAIDYEYIKTNPCSKVKLFKEPPGRTRYLTREEIVLLLDNCAEEIKPIIIVALNSGMRKGEIFNLKWQDVDLQNRFISIQQSKSNTKRMIPINDAVYKVFDGLQKTNDKVFKVQNFRILFERAVNKAGIKDFTFHGCRHSFASHMAMSGANLTTIKELLGHASIKMTLRYAHLCNGYLGDAVKKLQITP
ncbi:MAG: tyrosine-type recombinase/integrase [bacterium]